VRSAGRAVTPLPCSPQRRFDLGRQEEQVELVGVVRIERMESQSLPPGGVTHLWLGSLQATC
jgi:hypothetical protein